MTADGKAPSGQDLVAWFHEVTEEIDGTPARLRTLAARRRDLAQQLVQVYGWDEAAVLAGVSSGTLAALALEGAMP